MFFLNIGCSHQNKVFLVYTRDSATFFNHPSVAFTVSRYEMQPNLVSTSLLCKGAWFVCFHCTREIPLRRHTPPADFDVFQYRVQSKRQWKPQNSCHKETKLLRFPLIPPRPSILHRTKDFIFFSVSNRFAQLSALRRTQIPDVSALSNLTHTFLFAKLYFTYFMSLHRATSSNIAQKIQDFSFFHISLLTFNIGFPSFCPGFKISVEAFHVVPTSYVCTSSSALMLVNHIWEDIFYRL